MRKPVLSAAQQEARVKNVVADLLFRTLIVPKVFVDANWPDLHHRVDVMAVDRSGAGDVHVIEIKVGTGALRNAAASVMFIPAHFKYLAVFDNGNYMPRESSLYAPDGMGRIGVIQVKENETGDLSAVMCIRPERFRFGSTFKDVDRFTAENSPYIEIRE